MQFGAAGIHSDVLVQIRWEDEVRLKPISHLYVAEALNEVFPCIPPVNDILTLSGGEMTPQSEINIQLKKCSKSSLKLKCFIWKCIIRLNISLCGRTNISRNL